MKTAAIAFLLIPALLSCGEDEAQTPVKSSSRAKTLKKKPPSASPGEAEGTSAAALASRQEHLSRAIVAKLKTDLEKCKDSFDREEMLGDILSRSEKLGRLAQPLVPVVEAVLSDKVPATRGAALLALAAISGDNSRHQLEKGLKDGEAEVRECAAMAWVRAGIRDIKPILAAAEDEIESKTQLAMMLVVEKLGQDFHVPQVADLLDDLDSFSAKLAFRFFLRHKEKAQERMPGVVSLLDRSDSGLRLLVAQGLKDLGNKSKETLGALIKALEDEDTLVRKAADDTLVALSGEDLGFVAEAPEEARGRVVEKWREWLKNKH